MIVLLAFLFAVSFLATFGVSAYLIASNWPAEGAPLCSMGMTSRPVSGTASR